MSESHYWPTEPGVYQIEADAGYTDEWTLGSDGMWTCDDPPTRSFWTREMASDGYLGVRREQVAEPDLTALIREAIAEFRRDVKQPTKAADWAFKWVSRFVEAVER